MYLFCTDPPICTKYIHCQSSQNVFDLLAEIRIELESPFLTLSGRVMHLYIYVYTCTWCIYIYPFVIYPSHHQAIIWSNPADTRRNNNVIMTSKRRRFDVIMTLLRRVPVGNAGTFKKMHLKMSSAKWQPFYVSLNALTTNNVTNNVWS